MKKQSLQYHQDKNVCCIKNKPLDKNKIINTYNNVQISEVSEAKACFTNRRDNRVQLFDFDEDFICRWQTKDKSKVMELLCDRGVNALFFAKTMLAAAGIKLNPEKEKQLNTKIPKG